MLADSMLHRYRYYSGYVRSTAMPTMGVRVRSATGSCEGAGAALLGGVTVVLIRQAVPIRGTRRGRS
jgi:hypothetical protein